MLYKKNWLDFQLSQNLRQFKKKETGLLLVMLNITILM